MTLESVNKFWEWFDKISQGMSVLEIEKLSQSPRGRISNSYGKKLPTALVCRSIAKGLGIPEIEVLRQAGIAPPQPEKSPGENDLIDTYRRLSKPQQQFLLDMLRGLRSERHLKFTDSRIEYNVEETKVDKVKRMQRELAEEMSHLSAEEMTDLNDPQLNEAIKALMALNPQQMNLLRVVSQQVGRPKDKPTEPK
jgi:hypothetical protein